MPVRHARPPTFQQGLPVDVQHCMFRWNLSDLGFEASAALALALNRAGRGNHGNLSTHHGAGKLVQTANGVCGHASHCGHASE